MPIFHLISPFEAYGQAYSAAASRLSTGPLGLVEQIERLRAFREEQEFQRQRRKWMQEDREREVSLRSRVAAVLGDEPEVFRAKNARADAEWEQRMRELRLQDREGAIAGAALALDASELALEDIASAASDLALGYARRYEQGGRVAGRVMEELPGLLGPIARMLGGEDMAASLGRIVGEVRGRRVTGADLADRSLELIRAARADASGSALPHLVDAAAGATRFAAGRLADAQAAAAREQAAMAAQRRFDLERADRAARDAMRMLEDFGDVGAATAEAIKRQRTLLDNLKGSPWVENDVLTGNVKLSREKLERDIEAAGGVEPFLARLDPVTARNLRALLTLDAELPAHLRAVQGGADAAAEAGPATRAMMQHGVPEFRTPQEAAVYASVRSPEQHGFDLKDPLDTRMDKINAYAFERQALARAWVAAFMVNPPQDDQGMAAAFEDFERHILGVEDGDQHATPLSANDRRLLWSLLNQYRLSGGASGGPELEELAEGLALHAARNARKKALVAYQMQPRRGTAEAKQRPKPLVW